MKSNYNSVEELLCDESFLLYCKELNTTASDTKTGAAANITPAAANAAHMREWESWQELCPHKKALVEAAIRLLNDIRQAEKRTIEAPLSEKQLSKALGRLMKNLDQETIIPHLPPASN